MILLLAAAVAEDFLVTEETRLQALPLQDSPVVQVAHLEIQPQILVKQETDFLVPVHIRVLAQAHLCICLQLVLKVPPS